MQNDGMADILDGVAQILSGVAKTLREAPAATVAFDPMTSAGPSVIANPRPFDGAAERVFDEAEGKMPAPLDPSDPFAQFGDVKPGMGSFAEVVADTGMAPLPCEEATRQENDPERRPLLARDPVEWMSQAAYYCVLLSDAHKHVLGVEERVEDLVRCLEALPGHADKRIYDLATANVQNDIDAYIAAWIEAYDAVALNVETGRVDQDHQTRLLFRLGGEPNFYNTEDEEAA